MRYIRTKDGKVFDIEKIKNEVRSYSPQSDYVFGSFTATEYGEIKVPVLINGKNDGVILDCDGDEFKESDSIEELCDCFVYKISPVSWRIFNKPLIEKEDLSDIRDRISWYGRHSKTMYGAIETDKGLIYVAKANEKGELELL